MDKFLYISMTGAKEALDAQRLRANNLANVSTSGFKADFHQYRTMAVFGDHFPSRAYAMSERPGTDKSEGVYMETARDLDLAIKGKGWFAVQMPDGSEAYTRAGDLKRDVTGAVTTGTGLPVLGDGGPVVLPEYDKLVVGVDGTLSITGLGEDALSLTQIARIKLVNPDENELVKGEDGLFRLKGGGELQSDPEVQVINGMLEGSNVNPVNEMTSIISHARLYEMNVKMMQAAKEMDEASARIMQN
ncbi:MAG: flagellar biosynthesis protein FlgF [Pseudomonadales bacterium]|jgi:flagellar basal-body rod protein FlgF|uniref:flagellar basal body rod protein FlgF n=1 Tax=unclassified Ketobacter TaxID=2639109 RepID=UPI000C3DB288|nr:MULTISPECIES: flagellar basal body rod protein FlgF [unclassified Ketobacter]MAQ24994.1 flagellar biosynthesis protein FlgF [Pseudomonadales bacterium]MEC8810543.1 flagellar basal body rod protein FlgF [Pseudomonadota bacterium]TNC89720.1 MAG: flagellar biosynthesis protein FlgF [Alcanivorax sp.]HAG94305.1 flagellar biosynthesis protein FlgF [Gammaproteobacteria bacterium]MBI26844.1 flagellar biosynthesis protein FlgF [Pseudomonadales bacterium]|tara:strand:+ start:53076 stop:53813 length:738 start_codon:yes stop_codon:yes gene_type:complete